MVTREELHNMIDCLPESVLEASRQVILDFLYKEDPVLYPLITAPEDDEPETGEERAAGWRKSIGIFERAGAI